MMFTEEEKNEIIAHIVQQRLVHGKIGCPVPFPCHPEARHVCVDIFPELKDSDARCACHLFKNIEYVKDKFWKAME